MRAVILATGYEEALEPLVSFRPIPLFRILDKPFLDFIVESLVRQGVKKIDLILSHLPQMIESHLKKGEKWGISLTYHLTKDCNFPLAPLPVIATGWKEKSVLLGSARTFPQLELAWVDEVSKNEERPSLLHFPSGAWSHWGMVPTEYLCNLPPQTPITKLYEDLNQTSHLHVKTRPIIEIQTLNDLLQANISTLSNQLARRMLPLTVREVRSKIWISHKASIHPTAKIYPPAFVGEHCQIGPYTKIGPNAIVENHCFIDEETEIKNCLISQMSYVGPHLNLQKSIVDRNTLINIKHNTKIQIQEDFILSELNANHLKESALEGFEKGIAFLLYTFFYPSILILRLFRYSQSLQVVKKGGIIAEVSFFSPYQKSQRSLPRGFWNKLPLLWSIYRGDLHFIGVKPKTMSQFKQLPKEWQNLYLQAKGGLITLEEIEYGNSATEDESYACEAYYITHRSLSFDFKLLAKYFFR